MPGPPPPSLRRTPYRSQKASSWAHRAAFGSDVVVCAMASGPMIATTIQSAAARRRRLVTASLSPSRGPARQAGGLPLVASASLVAGAARRRSPRNSRSTQSEADVNIGRISAAAFSEDARFGGTGCRHGCGFPQGSSHRGRASGRRDGASSGLSVPRLCRPGVSSWLGAGAATPALYFHERTSRCREASPSASAPWFGRLPRLRLGAGLRFLIESINLDGAWARGRDR